MAKPGFKTRAGPGMRQIGLEVTLRRIGTVRRKSRGWRLMKASLVMGPIGGRSCGAECSTSVFEGKCSGEEMVRRKPAERRCQAPVVKEVTRSCGSGQVDRSHRIWKSRVRFVYFFFVAGGFAAR
jgi:hypothetical protein